MNRFESTSDLKLQKLSKWANDCKATVLMGLGSITTVFSPGEGN